MTGESKHESFHAEVRVRRAETVNDCQDCESVQLQAWENVSPVPVHILRPIVDQGGLVINAYDKAGSPIGTNISFLGKHETQPILYSHMTGVVPEYQGRGVGLLLKLKQREYALEQGFDLVCWTYDPMQSPNNWFNLNKLGTVSRTYHTNYYGSMPDKVNQGLESDRFLAEWWIRSRRVELRTKDSTTKTETYQGVSIANESEVKDGIPQPSGHVNLSLNEDTCLVEIPYNYNNVRESDPSILISWRLETREVYLHYVSKGYVATDAVATTGDYPRSFVKLERRPLERILQN